MNLDHDIRTYFDQLAERTPVPVRGRRRGSAVRAAKRATVGVTLAGLVLVGVVTIVPRTLFGGGLGNTASLIAPPSASVPPFHYVEPTGPACSATAIEAKQVSDNAFAATPKPGTDTRPLPAQYPGLLSFELINTSRTRCLLPWTPQVTIVLANGSTVAVRAFHFANAPTRQAVEPGGHGGVILEYDTRSPACLNGPTLKVEGLAFKLLGGTVRSAPSPSWRLRLACAVHGTGIGSVSGRVQVHVGTRE